MPTTTTTINRTGYADTRRAEGWEGIHTDTVPSGPSAVRNAEGARLPTGPRSCSRWVTEAVLRDSEVTAVSSAYPHALSQRYRHAESRPEAVAS